MFGLGKHNIKKVKEYLFDNDVSKRLGNTSTLFLALIVILVTTYILILPGIAMEKESYCGYEAHTHGEACYEMVPVCGKEETGEVRTFNCQVSPHTHTEVCYDSQGNLICGYADYIIHSHDKNCYDNDGNLVCTLPEAEPHTHTPDCYTEQQEFVCGQDEGDNHTHTEDCYVTTPVLTCGYEDTTEHVHTQDCFTILDHEHTDTCRNEKGYLVCGGLICGKTEVLKHQHTDACWSVKEGHKHTSECMEKRLICDIPEHKHTDACYDIDKAVSERQKSEAEQSFISMYNSNADDAAEDPYDGLQPICGKQAHIHNEACYSASGELTCKKEEHKHTDICYNPEDLLRGRLAPFLQNVTIQDKDGVQLSGDGTVYVGEKYTIHLEFKELGTQSAQLVPDEEGNLTYQFPSVFMTTPKEQDLIVNVNGEDIKLGTWKVDENGKLTIHIDDDKRELFDSIKDFGIGFDITGTVVSSQQGGKDDFSFGGVGQDFNFKVTDQPRVSVKKQGHYVENEDKDGGTIQYTVKTVVDHGDIYDMVVSDVLTPPSTDALELNLDRKDGKPDVTVKVRRNGKDEDITLEPDDYEIVEVTTDSDKKQSFKVKLKGQYNPLNEGDVLEVTYPYQVEYVPGSTDIFWGNVANDVTVTGEGKVSAPSDQPDKETPEIDIDEHMGSNVEIQVTPPGDGIVFKTQEFSEKNHTLHYTLYTVVPAGTWTPFYIQDDMAVEFDGQKYNLTEFKENSRVSNLTISAVDVERNKLGGWKTQNSEEKQQNLEKLKESAHKLKGYDIYDMWSGSPKGYDSKSVENCIRLWNNNNLGIIFGEWEYGKTSAWGNWNYPKDRLIITEYDLDMSNDRGLVTLVSMSDYKTTIKKEASEVLLAGITNTVHMRFSGYNPGYAVFFNNADRMNKTGVADKSDNTIEYTVTLNTTDTTVNKYFQDITNDWIGQGVKHEWNVEETYSNSMQAVFYDKLPDGWEYVEDSLTVTVCDLWGSEASYPYDTDRKLNNHALVTQDGDKQVISAPLMLFYDNGNTWRPNLFDWLGSELTSLTFTYKIKAPDQWVYDHAADTTPVQVSNHAEIRDTGSVHWSAEETIPYIPAKLTKHAEVVKNTTRLKFTLDVNPGGTKISDGDLLKIKDNSQGLNIYYDTIKVTDEHGEDVEFDISQTENGHFELLVPDGKHLLITYEAIITGKGDVTVSNQASINGVNDSDSSFKETFDVDQMINSSSSSGTTSQLTVMKKDALTGDLLKGAEFDYYIVRIDGSQLTQTDVIRIGDKDYSCYHNSKMHITTGNDGSSVLSEQIENGNYYIFKETKAPDGYLLDEDPFLVYLGRDEATDTNVSQSVIPDGADTRMYVSNTPAGCYIPEAGGRGPNTYVMAGMSLLCVAYLIYAVLSAKLRKSA